MSLQLQLTKIYDNVVVGGGGGGISPFLISLLLVCFLAQGIYTLARKLIDYRVSSMSPKHSNLKWSVL
jgi:hypothetical protein